MAEQVVVITGSSAGLGGAMAVQLARHPGYKIVLLARRQDMLDAVAAKCLGRATTIVADVSKREEVDRAVAAVLAEFGTIDIFVNNVGRGCNVLPSALDDDIVADMMQFSIVNVMSAIYCMQAVLPTFKKNKAGLFVTVSSMLGRMPQISTIRSAYAAAKHFLNDFFLFFLFSRFFLFGAARGGNSPSFSAKHFRAPQTHILT
ncbi:hypothetical protein T492DRAFT_845931 [Pavlovales sp. CCMP2436]|nr:hypothetical protein T492DRAFT_845931 [Pavlovales sp. CCMP2436]